MKCPHCNQEHPSDTKYCPQTGRKLEHLKACLLNPNCPDYGKYILPMDSVYCPTCGCKLDGNTCIKIEMSDNGEIKKNPSKYLCNVCGYIYEGMQTPSKCPICKAPASKFEVYCPTCREPMKDNSGDVVCPFCGSDCVDEGYDRNMFYCNDCEQDFYIPGCPSCGSHKVTSDITNWLQYRCEECSNRWGTPFKALKQPDEKIKDKKGNLISCYFEVYNYVLGESTMLEHSMYDEVRDTSLGIDLCYKNGILWRVSFNSIEALPDFYKKIGITKNKDMFTIWMILEQGCGFEVWQSTYEDKIININARIPYSTKYGLELSFHITKIDEISYCSITARQSISLH